MKDFSNKKILIFSDTHLTCRFDEKWFEEIVPLVQKADIVIINGDLWESTSCRFKKFLKSKWNNLLFPLLKNKTIFIYGNHDYENRKKIDSILFSKEHHDNFKFKSGKKIFEVTHGDKISSLPYSFHKRLSKWLKKIPGLYLWLKGKEEKEGILFWPLQKYISRENNNRLVEYKKFYLKNKEDNLIRIFGHVHKPKHNLEDNFIILGSFKKGNKRYIEIDNGKIKFINENY